MHHEKSESFQPKGFGPQLLQFSYWNEELKEPLLLTDRQYETIRSHINDVLTTQKDFRSLEEIAELEART